MYPSFRRLFTACALAIAGAALANPAFANTTWQWGYAGAGISAGGTLTTADTPDGNGFYQILSIAGSRNGDAITGLVPAGTAIPGNEPYAVDNLIKLGSSGQISGEGFGYSLASGAYANPYFADFLSPPAYTEVFTQGAVFTELPISFSAAPVPEPSSLALALSGLGGWALALRRKRHGA